METSGWVAYSWADDGSDVEDRERWARWYPLEALRRVSRYPAEAQSCAVAFGGLGRCACDEPDGELPAPVVDLAQAVEAQVSAIAENPWRALHLSHEGADGLRREHVATWIAVERVLMGCQAAVEAYWKGGSFEPAGQLSQTEVDPSTPLQVRVILNQAHAEKGEAIAALNLPADTTEAAMRVEWLFDRLAHDCQVQLRVSRSGAELRVGGSWGLLSLCVAEVLTDLTGETARCRLCRARLERDGFSGRPRVYCWACSSGEEGRRRVAADKKRRQRARLRRQAAG